MRRGAIIVLWALAGCAVPNGTYFEVDGEPGGITFDQVEFFLGKDVGGVDQRLHTPARPFDLRGEDTELERHRMVKRLFTASDVQTTAQTRSLTYYLTTESDTTAQSANYLLVVASRGGVPVGVAEVEEFTVRDDGAYLYELALVPIDDGFERWGNLDVPGASCARWTRPRGDQAVTSTYAVVRAGDFDCDDVKADAECDDLNYCAAANTCQGRTFSCIDPVGCNLGVCLDTRADQIGGTTCSPVTCLPGSFCSTLDTCDAAGPVQDFLACALENQTSHIEVTMPVKTVGGALCLQEYFVTPAWALSCLEPRIEAPLHGKVDTWTFTVREAQNGLSQCAFKLHNPDAAAAPPLDTHLVVSVVSATAGNTRTSFVIGFQPSQLPGCDNMPTVEPPETGTPEPSCR